MSNYFNPSLFIKFPANKSITEKDVEKELSVNQRIGKVRQVILSTKKNGEYATVYFHSWYRSSDYIIDSIRKGIFEYSTKDNGVWLLAMHIEKSPNVTIREKSLQEEEEEDIFEEEEANWMDEPLPASYYAYPHK